MDRCALFVDAGYVLTDGAMAVHGTRRRESVSWDYAGLLQLFGNLAMERARLPLLRCYWYEATVEGRRSADHDTLADLPGVKVRVAKMRPGRREGVEGEIHRDLTMLARNKAVSDVMLVSAEEDLAQMIAEVQDMGMRVTLLHIAVDGNWTIARALRQECDDIVEISASHLRPYVELISGAEPPHQDDSDGVSLALRPLVNGSVNGIGMNGNGNGNGAGHGVGYAQQGRPSAGQLPSALPAPAEPAARQVPQPVTLDAAPAERGQPEHPEGPGPGNVAANADFGAPADYRAAADYPPVDRAPSVPAADEQGSDYGAAYDYGTAVDYVPVPDYAMPAPVPAREDFYAAPVAVPAPVHVNGPADELLGERDWQAGRGRPGGDLAAYNPGGVRDQYQRDGVLREAPSAVDGGDRLQPVPIALPGGGSAQVRRLPTRGQQGLGLPPGPTEAGIGQQPGGPPLGQPASGQPTGSQPVLPVAPVVPMDYPGRGAAPGGPRQVLPGPGAPGGPVPQGAPVPPAGPGPQSGQQVPPSAPAPPAPGGQQPSGGYPGVVPGVSLADAVQSAHEEGQAFGDSVARDAPALWLEAVLARKPRMPSDLEARLLQGSALPIDFLLHDEVRHALRRGFWDALERARR